MIFAHLGIKSLIVWKTGNEEKQHLIAATTIDVSFFSQNPFRAGAVAEGSQFSGKLVYQAINFIITAACQTIVLLMGNRPRFLLFPHFFLLYPKT